MIHSIRKVFSVASVVLIGAPIVGASVASANVTCRDYYQSYVDQSTMLAPVVIVGVRPNFHGHYPEYHDRGFRDDRGGYGRGGGRGDDEAGDIAALAILGGLTTTSAVQDSELNDAQNVLSIIDQAQMGDGPQLREFLGRVQSDSKPGSIITLSQVADAVLSADQKFEFCLGGDLDSERELASQIAADLGVRK